MPAISEESFEQAYRDIATRCSIPTEEDPKESIRRYLDSDTASQWLLTVDNADDEEILFGTPGGPKGLADHLPKSEHGLILFNTRHRGLAVSLVGSEIVEIYEMNDEEPKIFLEKSLTQKEQLRDQVSTAEMLTEPTYLPLAIVHCRSRCGTIYLFCGRQKDAISLLG